MYAASVETRLSFKVKPPIFASVTVSNVFWPSAPCRKKQYSSIFRFIVSHSSPSFIMGRRKGNSAFPVARIKKMMQSDDDVGKIATVTPVLVAKALECMMEQVLTEAAQVARDRHTRTVTPQHLRHCVLSNDAFDFLRPTLAHVQPLEEGGKVRKKRQRSPPGGESKVKRNRCRAGEGEDDGEMKEDTISSPMPVVGEAAEMEVGGMARHLVGDAGTGVRVGVVVEGAERLQDDDDDYDEEDVQEGGVGRDGARAGPHNASDRVSVHALLS